MKDFKRILIKLSWESISGSDFMFDYDKIDQIAKDIINLHQKWIEIAIVCGAGNIRRYRDTVEAGIDRVKSDHLGMMATVMNAVLINDKIVKNGQKWIVFSSLGVHIPPITKEYNSLSARKKLSDWYIVFCAGGSGNPYSTTDLGAVLRALELECDVVVKATKVDGIYNKDPKKYQDAKKIQNITFEEIGQLWLNVMDQSAVWMARENNMPIFVCNMDQLFTFSKNTQWTRVKNLDTWSKG